MAVQTGITKAVDTIFVVGDSWLCFINASHTINMIKTGIPPMNATIAANAPVSLPNMQMHATALNTCANPQIFVPDIKVLLNSK